MRPVGSFDALTPRPTVTAADIVAGRDLSALRVIVTGGASGIGLETAAALATAGARVTVAARRLTPARRADLAHRFGPAEVELADLDLASIASIREVAGQWRGHLDILINNAGVMACPLGRTRDGFETQMGVNHHGHSLLTRLLLPALIVAPAPRVITLSSPGQRHGTIDLGDLHYARRPYDPIEAYGASKTATSLFVIELHRRYAGDGIRSVAVFPGGISTPLLRHMDDTLYDRMGAVPVDRRPPGTLKTPQQGAATTVWAAIDPKLDDGGGLHLADCAIAPAGAPRGVCPHAVDPDLTARLWDHAVRETDGC